MITRCLHALAGWPKLQYKAELTYIQNNDLEKSIFLQSTQDPINRIVVLNLHQFCIIRQETMSTKRVRDRESGILDFGLVDFGGRCGIRNSTIPIPKSKCIMKTNPIIIIVSPFNSHYVFFVNFNLI
jgi:hypothetical protein